jgi:hypothetical protein
MPRDGSEPHIKLRTAENAELIISLTEEGYSAPQIARQLGCTDAAIFHWIREDGQRNGGSAIAQRYARATEIRWERLAEGLIELVGRDCRVDGKPDNALVQQLRLEVDTHKWLLSKMLPRRFGDKVEITSDPDAPVVTRIELVAVHPQQRIEPPTIEGKAGADDGQSDG